MGGFNGRALVLVGIAGLLVGGLIGWQATVRMTDIGEMQRRIDAAEAKRAEAWRDYCSAEDVLMRDRMDLHSTRRALDKLNAEHAKTEALLERTARDLLECRTNRR